MKEIKCYLPDINFCIEVEEKYYDLVIKKVNESIIKYNKNTEKTINIRYTVNKKLFVEIANIIKESDGKIYNSFKNQTHKELLIDNKYYYLVNCNEYICEKTNDFEYQIIVEKNNEVSANWIVRIIRELYLREKEDKGFSFMHGTGLKIKNRGLLLLGASGSGKTTLAVKFLDINITKEFLSNDRILLNKEGYMDYFPHAVTYAMGTVKNNKHLEKYFKTTKILEKNKNIVYKEAKYSDDCNTPLTDTEKIFKKTKMLPRCQLTNIIYPRFEKNMDGYELIDMSKEEINYLLEQTNFTPEDKEALRKPWIRKRYMTEENLLEYKNELIEKIMENVSVKKLKYGINVKVEEILNKI